MIGSQSPIRLLGINSSKRLTFLQHNTTVFDTDGYIVACFNGAW
jgi:hypothetical protein